MFHFKQFQLKSLLFLLAAFSVAFGDLTIHILSPWGKDSVRAISPVYIQSSEAGWYPGNQMTSDFGGWLTYTFKTTKTTDNDHLQLMSVIPTSEDLNANRLNYTGGVSQIIFKTIFTGHEDANEIWINLADTTKDPKIQFISPPLKVFRFFKPWEIGGAFIEIKNIGTFKMKGLGDYCGWSTFVYYTDMDNLLVKFRNTLDNTYYSSNGPGDGAYIDLSTTFAQNDTAWILASSAGKPSIGTVFPGKLGDCSPITITSMLRDISDSTHPDFNKGACSSGKVAFPGLVTKHLGSNGKPVKSNTANCLSTQTSDWFTAESFGDGFTNEKCLNMTLQKNDDGLYVYDTSDFFPLDSFQYLDANKTKLNPNGVLRYGHNFSFTMETGAEFEYVKGQQFYFRGDDDVWVYIDSMLVVDLGGIHYPVEGSVNLDTLGLTPGKTYSFKLFYCERNCCGSSFRMVTSIALRTSSKLYYTDSILAPGTTQYDMYEKVTKDNMACDASELPIDTIKATVEFYIEGPPFNTPLKLSSGTAYGGITVLPDYSGVIIDQSSITGLTVGDYIIHYYSTKDRSMEGVLKFSVTVQPRIGNPVKSAAYFSDNGKGSVDRAEIYFTDTLTTVPDSVLLLWPSILDRKLVTSGIVLDPLNKRHITIHLANPFPKEITTYNGSSQLGKCYFYDSAFKSNPLITVPFSIADSVGPLIKSAVLIERVEPGNDTVLLTFSESLKDTALSGKSLILFKNGKKVTLSILKTLPKGDTTVFVIEDQKENAPGRYDSIALNSSGPVRDAYGNTAHPDNRPVPFTVIEKPRADNPVKSAAYFSDNGKGSVDRAEIYFTDTLTTVPDSVLLLWPSILDRKLVTSGIVLDPLNKRHITIHLANPFPKEITTYNGSSQLGKCYFYDSAFKSNPLITVPFSIADSVGPLIKSAVLIERVEPGNDTVLLTFSESLKDTALSGKSLILFKNGKKITLSILKTLPKGDTTVFVIEDQKENAPDTYDSIALNPAGPVCDLYGNNAHSDNRPVPFIIRKIPGKVIYAYYLDVDADGIVDKATLEFNKKVVLSEITASFSWVNSNKTATLDSIRFSYGKDSTEINVNLSRAFSKQSILTSGEMLVYVKSIGQQEEKGSSVADSASPVLTSAKLSPGIPRNGIKPPDTLLCSFSEPIRGINCVNPFLFSRTDVGRNIEYQMSLTTFSNSKDKWVFIIKDIRGVEFPESSDSVWINDTCGLSDTASNKQVNHGNHHVLLKVNSIPIDYDIKIGPNPIHLSDPGSEMVIRIEPSFKLKQFVKFYVDISIFDAVGNLVYKGHKESQDSPSMIVSFKWNGRNKNGRTVGSGTYLAIIKVHDLMNNSDLNVPKKIGVVR